jgi:hypothetical protein
MVYWLLGKLGACKNKFHRDCTKSRKESLQVKKDGEKWQA